MQLLLIRHALPRRSERGEGADPNLSEIGAEQAGRLPAALARFSVSRLISSPQRRATQTAEPVAAELGLSLEVDVRLAEYDREMAAYVPLEQLRTEYPEQWARMSAGHLPAGVDEAAFRQRVAAGIADVVESSGHEDTVAVFSHGGVINALLHDILGTRRLLSFPIDYASVSRVLYARSGQASVVATNGTEHVWDLLPRNRR
jgi:broad specificity phosphatase PhoE